MCLNFCTLKASLFVLVSAEAPILLLLDDDYVCLINNIVVLWFVYLVVVLYFCFFCFQNCCYEALPCLNF